jgi:hypothetical protein
MAKKKVAAPASEDERAGKIAAALVQRYGMQLGTLSVLADLLKALGLEEDGALREKVRGAAFQVLDSMFPVL